VVMTMAPAELRREVTTLRTQLEEANAEATRANEALAAAQIAAEERVHAQEVAHEERFEDMKEFMVGLLRKLKAENETLQQQLEQSRRLSTVEETDEFISIEAAVEGETDAECVSSPLKEARLHRFVASE